MHAATKLHALLAGCRAVVLSAGGVAFVFLIMHILRACLVSFLSHVPTWVLTYLCTYLRAGGTLSLAVGLPGLDVLQPVIGVSDVSMHSCSDHGEGTPREFRVGL